MSRLLIDTNVLLDIATADSHWLDWSRSQARAAAERGRLLINPIIYAELAPAFMTAEALNDWLDPTVFERASLPYAAGWLAAQAFITYRRAGGARHSPLPDFYIGAHAEAEGLTLVFPRRDVDCPVTVSQFCRNGFDRPIVALAKAVGSNPAQRTVTPSAEKRL